MVVFLFFKEAILKKEYRIKKNSEIQHLISKKTTVGNGYFILYHQKNHDSNHFRFAVSVSKKYGNAVERNLMKRRIREVIKVISFLKESEFFIVAKPRSKGLEFDGIKTLLENLFAQAKILGEKV